MGNSPFIVILVTVSSESEANIIAKTMVTERLAACVSIVPGLISHYIWKGKKCREKEVLLVMKARASAFPRIEKRVKALHSYTVPEIIALPIAMGSRSYLAWLLDSTEPIKTKLKLANPSGPRQL